MIRRLYILIVLFIVAHILRADDGTDRYASHSVLSEGKWVKIRVSDAGVYQLTHSALRSMGFSNPDNVRLYGLHLEVLPETNIEDIDDDLVELPLYRLSDKMLFYGRGQTRWTLAEASASSAAFTHFNNPYSNYTYYFLTEDASSKPKEFETYAYNVPSSATVCTTFPEHALIERDGFSYIHTGRTFFDSYDYANGNSQSYKLALPGIESSTPVRLEVQFCAACSAASTLSVQYNGQEVGTLKFQKLGSYDYGDLKHGTYTIDEGNAASNTVRLTHTRQSGLAGHLDYIRASYIRQLQMSDNSLVFRPQADGDVIFRLTGGNEQTVVWRISRADAIEELAGTYDATAGTWSFPFTSESATSDFDWHDEELVAVNPSSTFPAPSVVGTISNQDLHAERDIDLVIVVPASGRLTQQAQRLADAHTAADSMRCLVVSADKIYNEFSSGTPDATAIRRFMKMLYDQSSTASGRPRNLLLFGDCLWDNRLVTSGVSSFDADDLLLAYESDNSLSHTDSYILEEYFALLDDNAPTNLLRALPRIGVGRIPVTTVSEARDVVDKLISYITNEQVGSWKNTIAMLCDDGNNNIHMKDGDAVIQEISSRYPDYRVERIYWDTYTRVNGSTGKSYPDVEKAIDKRMQDGALIVNYFGHGAAYCLSHEQVLRTSDFAEWASPRLPLWVTSACDVAPFDMNEENIAETALLNPNGAAMGLVTTARTVYSTQNRALNIRYIRYVLGHQDNGRQYTIGEALSAAKCDYIETKSFNSQRYNINKAHYVLLGDPAIRLRIPSYKIQIDRINHTDATSDTSVKAGSKVVVEGHITDENGNLAEHFNGLVSPTVFDNIEQVTCKDNTAGEQDGNDEGPHTFSDRIRTLFAGTDSVSGGRFKFTFPIPLDNNYSGQQGLISLYATTADHTLEANGRFEQFVIDGTDTYSDTDGPQFADIRLNNSPLVDDTATNSTPLLTFTLSDPSGINTTGNGVGHDITLVIDNDETQTYSLNSYFTPTIGSYESGAVAFPIPTLTEGQHTLTLRAFDTLNNAATVTRTIQTDTSQPPTIHQLTVNSPVRDEAVFTIRNNRPQSQLQVTLHIYDISGRSIWQSQQNAYSGDGTLILTWDTNATNNHLIPGVYIVRATIAPTDNSSASTSQSAKFIVLGSQRAQ